MSAPSPEFGTIVVVLGMHRSGTSALTRVLAWSGLGLPENLIPPAPDNERGFWESKPIKTLNENILSYFGQSWRSLAAIDDRFFKEEWMQQMRSTAADLLREEFTTGPDIVLKDPRLCRLMPFWRDVLRDVAKRVVFVTAVRDPVEVAQSLHVRNGLPLRHGLLLWTRYALDAEFATRGEARAFVNFTDLLADWRSVVDGLRNTLSLPFETEHSPSQIDAYLSPELRHHARPEDSGRLLRITRDSYEVFLRWANGEPETPGDHANLDRARTQLDDFAEVLSNFSEQSRRYSELVASVVPRLNTLSEQLGTARGLVGSGEENADLARSQIASATAGIEHIADRLTRTASAAEWAPRELFAWLKGHYVAATDTGARMEITNLDTGVSAPNDGAMRTGIVRHVLSGFPDGQKVVDLGAGPCIFAKIARDAGHDVTAVDARTVRKPPDDELGSIKFVHADVRDFDVSGFDVVLYLGLLYHFDIEDQEKTLRRCNKATVILDCEVHVPELVQGEPKEWQTTLLTEGDYQGVRFPEGDNPMASVGNKTSFWHTQESMLRLFSNTGFSRLAAVDPLFTSKYGGRRFYVAS